MRVQEQVLTPGVQHGEETDLSAQMLGIGGDGEQGFGTDLEQEVVEDLLILQGERSKLMREREDDMEVGDGQQFGLPGR